MPDHLAALLANEGINVVKKGVSEERIKTDLPWLRERIAFYRAYPDLFVDELARMNPKNSFHFYSYQRIFLRAAMRYRYVYCVFPRGYSKSFLSMMALMLKCILYPGVHLAVSTGGKAQAASITIQKVDEICKLIPALANEINWARGVSKKSVDDVHYVFKNGSELDILAATERSRGQRRTGLLLEECVLIDGDILNEVLIPTTVIDRQLPDGSRHREEVVNYSQIFITTAGYKNSFAYQKLIEFLVMSIINPDEVAILGGTYKIPVLEGLQNENFIEQLKMSGTFNEEGFGREYLSLWAGDSENAFFSSERIDKCRKLLQPEYEYSKRSSKGAFYVLGIDIGRTECTTEVAVIKVTPQLNGTAIKSVVNFYSYEATDFEDQAIAIKKIFYKYKARVCAIDANGIGGGFVDFMTKSQIDPETGDPLPIFGIEGATYEGWESQYKKFKGPEVEPDAMFLIKASAPINTEGYTYIQVQLSSSKLLFLIDEAQASAKIAEQKAGQNMTVAERNEKLKPFILTSNLKEQMCNLTSENEGQNIILKQNNRGIGKDRFSALQYGLYYIKKWEDKQKNRRSHSLSDFMIFN